VIDVPPVGSVEQKTSLPGSPLVKVVAQVRYPRPIGFTESESIHSIADRMGESYPVARSTKRMALVVGPEGIAPQETERHQWVLSAVAEAWQITVADEFIALETNSYTSRIEFCERFNELVTSAKELLDPPVYDRLGVRYINHLTGEDILKTLPTLVTPPGLAGLVVSPRGAETIVHSLCDTLFSLDDAMLQARWGWMPGGTSIDLSVRPPSLPYWLLDTDVYTRRGGLFTAEELTDKVILFTEKAHDFFLSMTTPDLLANFRS
jgi:uncharacterized protein (TIGR04255 family)